MSQTYPNRPASVSDLLLLWGFPKKSRYPEVCLLWQSQMWIPPQQNRSGRSDSASRQHPHIFPVSCPPSCIIPDNDPAKITGQRLHSPHTEPEGGLWGGAWPHGLMPSLGISLPQLALSSSGCFSVFPVLRATAPWRPQTHRLHHFTPNPAPRGRSDHGSPCGSQLPAAPSLRRPLTAPVPSRTNGRAMLRPRGSTGVVGSRASGRGKIRIFHLL